MNRLFIPNGAIEFTDTVQLSSGVVLPKWAFVAVGLDGDVGARSTRRTGTPTVRSQLWMDLETGFLSREPGTPGRKRANRRRGPTSNTAPEHNYDDFSRVVDIGRVIADWEASLPRLEPFSKDTEVNPGYFNSVPAGVRTVTTVTVPATDTLSRDYPLSASYFLGDLLVAAYKRQDLVEQAGLTTRQIAENLKYLAVNVLEAVNAPNPSLVALQAAGNLGYKDSPVNFSIHSGLINTSQVALADSSRKGLTVRIEPTDATHAQVYLKAIDLATKIEFDEIRLDYYTDQNTLITITAGTTAGRRILGTYYDDQLVHPNRLVNILKSASAYSDITTPTVGGTTSDISFEEGDDYSTIEAILRDPSNFASLEDMLDAQRALGFGTNPNLSRGAQNQPGAGGIGTVAQDALGQLQSLIKCPEQKRNPSMFPIASHPSFRHLSDHTQLEDKKTQDVTPFNHRINNPLGVPVVKGVTDLKTRFGFLGEAGGKAVYRDHVGGAAAGLSYLGQQGGGQTLGGGLQGMLGGAMGALGKGQGVADDLTSITSGKMFGGMSQDLFGKSDPTGTLMSCATLDTGNMDQLIHTAASMAKNLSGLEKSPLTFDEWASAYQISKNQPNEHLKKTTTGVDLPAQEDPPDTTQDTGPRTDRQGKETQGTTDYAKRAEKQEKWNPVSNFEHYSKNIWGDGGTKWIQDGILKYEQKADKGDKEKMAKKVEAEVMNQVKENPSTVTLLDWIPTTTR